MPVVMRAACFSKISSTILLSTEISKTPSPIIYGVIIFILSAMVLSSMGSFSAYDVHAVTSCSLLTTAVQALSCSVICVVATLSGSAASSSAVRERLNMPPMLLPVAPARCFMESGRPCTKVVPFAGVTLFSVAGFWGVASVARSGFAGCAGVIFVAARACWGAGCAGAVISYCLLNMGFNVLGPRPPSSLSSLVVSCESWIRVSSTSRRLLRLVL